MEIKELNFVSLREVFCTFKNKEGYLCGANTTQDTNFNDWASLRKDEVDNKVYGLCKLHKGKDKVKVDTPKVDTAGNK